MEAVSLPSKYATDVATSLMKVFYVLIDLIDFMRMGSPTLLTSVQGREFRSEVDKKMMKLLGIKRHFTIPYQVCYVSI